MLGGFRTEMLHPDYPVINGRYQMTPDWALTLPVPVNRRFEDGSLVLWRPGLTMWVNVWGNNKFESRESRLQWIREDTSPDAFEAEVIDTGEHIQYGYRLTEDRDESVVHAFYGFAIGASGHVQVAIYFDVERDLELAKTIWKSIVASRAA
jgi:hypothetical protein